jgi:hypothetical protein
LPPAVFMQPRVLISAAVRCTMARPRGVLQFNSLQ